MEGVSPPLTADEARRVAAVEARLVREAAAQGFLPFDRFMEISLYAEEVGYYAQEADPFGPSGDFYTAPRVTPLFGWTVADRILAVRRALGGDRPFEIYEVGPGDGGLAASVLEGLTRQSSDLGGITYHLIERSAPLARRALARARAAARDGNVPVVEDPAVGSDGPFEGIVLGNEFLDAQPARRLHWTGTEWHELGFRAQEKRLEPAEAPLITTVPPPELPTPPEPDTVLEISPSAEGWVRSVADHLVRGELLLLDYGYDQPELLSAHSKGTVASVRRHRSMPRPEEAPGASDLSIFVNFTRIRDAARRAGLIEIAYGSQAGALGDWGFAEELASAVKAARSAEEEVRTRLAAKNLLFGFDRFRALELAAPSSSPALSTLTRPDA